MDKELLRVVIIATGLLVILAMLAWHFFKNRTLPEDDKPFGGTPKDRRPHDSLALHDGLPDFDSGPETRPRYAKPEEPPAADPMFAQFDEFPDIFSADDEPSEEEPQTPRFTVPEIIQFSLIANPAQGFNGLDLLTAFQIAHLEYGSLKIFERMDANRLVDFGVACMLDSGTFPETGMESFYCPGLVFFMQPSLVDNPADVFDDFVETIKILAIELDGEILDHQRQPLTEATLQLFRQSL